MVFADIIVKVLTIELSECDRRDEIADGLVLVYFRIVPVIVQKSLARVLCEPRAVRNFWIQKFLGVVKIIEPGLEFDGRLR